MFNPNLTNFLVIMPLRQSQKSNSPLSVQPTITLELSGCIIIPAIL